MGTGLGSVFGYPLQGDVFWYKEAAYGAGIPTISVSCPTMWVSEVVTTARIDVAETKRGLRGISEPSICAFVSTTSDYSLHLEWVWEKTDAYSIVSCCINRGASATTFVSDLPPLCFVVCTNEKMSTASQTFYTLKGAKAKNINIKGNINTEYVCSADFSVASVSINPAYPTGQATWKRPAVPTAGQYAFFNRAGAIVRRNSTTTMAFIVDGFDCTINNHLTDMWNAGTSYKQNSIAGQMDVTGAAEITLDRGGQNYANTLYTQMTNVLVDTNNGNIFDILTLTTAEWQGGSWELNTGDAPMKTSAKFTAKKAALSS